MMARKKKIHHRHNRLSFGGKLAVKLRRMNEIFVVKLLITIQKLVDFSHFSVFSNIRLIFGPCGTNPDFR